MTAPIVVADAGPLIALGKCGQLQLLTKVFGKVHVPQTVLAEAVGGKQKPETEGIKAFVTAHCTVQPDRDDLLFRHLMTHLDAGESQAISWAQHLGCAVLIDERLGRLAAQAQALPLFGSLGLLLLAKQAGHLKAVAPVIAQMCEQGYLLGDALVASVLRQAREN